MKFNKNIIIFGTFLFVLILLAFSVKGHKGNPIYNQTEHDKLVGGPFESTNSSSRYALVEAIVENKTFFFNNSQAQFSAADIVSYNGKIFSVFTPGVSFAALPFYILGKQIGMPQLFTYFSTILFALINLYLVTKLGRKFGAGFYEALIGGILFIFGTNALSYALTLTQHHISTTLILLALLNAISERTFVKNILFGLLYAAGLLMDIPNGLMMLPLAIYVLYRHISFSEIGNKIKLSVKLNIIALLIGLVALVSVFAWYNFQTTGSLTRFAQSIGRVDFVEEGVVQKRKESAKENPFEKKSFYNTRKQLNGFYVLFVSNERGWLYYSPIVVIGILGFIYSLRKKETKTLVILAVSIILFCFVSYASFGDPWGGWSFGSRYLIPASALICAGIGVAIQKYKKNLLFILIFLVLLVYSVSVNSLGAMTTSAIPPKVEAIELSTPIPYTYEYNLNLMEENRSSSLLYNIFFYNITSFRGYLIGYIIAVVMLIEALYIMSIVKKSNTLEYEKN
ncbi:MAG: hypothetical protein Q7K55_05720 [Candidatus Levybacteria bacterium]|nr:hypothetical protein [Candidatus Levybacteria bacterium]